MKLKVIGSIMGILIIALGIVVWAQTEPSTTALKVAQQLALQDVAAQLDQMTQTLEQGNVTPGTLKNMTAQMKQMSQTLKEVAGVSDKARSPKPSCCQVGAEPPQAETN